MQRAAVELERGATYRAVGALFGVSDEAIRKWVRHPDWPTYVAAAKAIVRQEAVASNIVPIRPDVEPRNVPAPDGGDLVDHAVEVVRMALQEGDVRVAMWTLERIDPMRFGTPKDRQAMAELQKTAADLAPRKVTVTVSAPPKRKAESA